MTAHLHAGTTLTRPLKVEQIVSRAQDYEYNPHIPLKNWLRTAGTLLKEASIYEQEGNDQQTYLLLFRHAQLVALNLSEHPDVELPENKSSFAKAKKAANKNLLKLESLQPRINKRYERYEQLLRDRETRRASASLTPASSEDVDNRPRQTASNTDPAILDQTEALAAGEKRDLAVQLARKEIRRRAIARKATRQAGISEETENERRTAGLWGNWEQDLTQDEAAFSRNSLSDQMRSVRAQVNGSSPHRTTHGRTHPTSSGSKQPFHYPSIPEQRRAQAKKIPSFTPDSPKSSPPSSPVPSSRPPQVPPKPYESQGKEARLPVRPAKEPIPDQRASSSSSNVAANGDQELEPSTLTFKPAAHLENGAPLRTIFLPPNLRHEFLSIARPNTRANLETCGILCGTLISNALFISKLVIPEQKSTSDTCETINESDLFDYIDGEDLIILGWIHTHPTQTCFMSSRDLHTHSGYQVMMPESIAIVCAPSKDEWGVFRLTDPPGMKAILNCTQSGLFHPHAESNVYTDALRPGHVFEAKGLEFDVVDMRR